MLDMCFSRGDAKHLKYACLTQFQWNLIMRGDDVCHFELSDLERSEFNGALKTKVKWSKNVQDERDCPPQFLFGAMESLFCILIGLAIWLEFFCRGEGQGSRFMFMRDRDDNAPNRLKGSFAKAMKTIRDLPVFRALIRLTRGLVGMHSSRKGPYTFARRE